MIGSNNFEKIVKNSAKKAFTQEFNDRNIKRKRKRKNRDCFKQMINY